MNKARQNLIEIFQKAKILLALPDNDYAWSSWENANDAILEVDEIVSKLQSGQLPDVLTMKIIFAPTGPMQEVSLSSGWAEPFLQLAEDFDAALEEFLRY